MRAYVVLAIFASGTLSNAASADWQYTKWGMSIEQAARASGGQLRPPTAQERSDKTANGVQPGLVGTYRSATFNFICTLYFPTPASGLGKVTLTAVNYQQARSIIESLRGLYGEPVEMDRDRFGNKFRWRDDAHNNSIEIYDLSSIGVLNVFYAPLRSGSEKGL
jgi:hypothetical protein